MCDGINNDCSAATADGSGESAPLNTLQAGVCAGSIKSCGGASGWQDDYSGVANYEAVEATCDGLNNDCDGSVDEGVTSTFYQDFDSDTFGNIAVSQQACSQPAGYVASSTDCNDNDANTLPGAAPLDSTTLCMKDTDNDNYGSSSPPAGVTAGTDCNDGNIAVNPGAAEVCTDSADNNCNGESDHDSQDGLHGDAACPVAMTACSGPASAVQGESFTFICTSSVAGVNSVNLQVDASTSCAFTGWVGNDAQFSCSISTTGSHSLTCSVEPAKSYQSGTDKTCSITVTSPPSCTDTDGDGYGNPGDASCPNGAQTDCNDNDANTFPGAAPLDSTTLCMKDTDGDNYGSSSPPAGVTAGTDCNDGNIAVNPGAAEICDGIDNNCANGVDDGLPKSWQKTGQFDTEAAGATNPTGIAFDSSDNTLWILHSFSTTDFVYHFSKTGTNLGNGFSTSGLGTNPRGITVDTADNTLWITDSAQDNVYHVTKTGTNLGNGFGLASSGALDSADIAYDTATNTLWVHDNSDQLVYHFSKTGANLGDGFTVPLGQFESDGIAFDPRDSTFWITETVDDFVYHFSKTGTNLGNGFSILGVTISALGITFDTTDNSLWIADGGFDEVFHYEYIC